MKGVKGDMGDRGSTGEQGMPGPRGISADESSLLSWNECVWENLNSATDYGYIAVSVVIDTGRNVRLFLHVTRLYLSDYIIVNCVPLLLYCI